LGEESAMINFPDSPSIGQTFVSSGQSWTWDGVKWTPSGTVVMPPLATGDNRIINGDMRIDQRNNGATGTAGGYTVDRWQYVPTQAGKIGWGRNYSSIGGPVGIPYCLGLQTIVAYTPLTTDYFFLYQMIEADMVSDFAWGTPNAQPVTLSFWAYCNVTSGNYSGSIRSGAGGRSYPFSFPLVANTWTKIIVTIPGDTGGTWTMSGNAGALNVAFNLGAGSNALGPANAWASAGYIGVTGSVQSVATLNGGLWISGVKLEVGSIATPFNRQTMAKSLADCQRYYQTTGGTYGTFFCGNVTTAIAYIYVARYPVAMRANPTVVLTHMSAAGFPAAAGAVSSVTTQSFAESRTANATVNAGYYGSSYTADAEL
jgi:hypothetical protein